MQALKVRVENGKIVGDPPGFSEGSEMKLCLAEPEEEMSEEEPAALRTVLDRAWRSVEAGRFRPDRPCHRGPRMADGPTLSAPPAPAHGFFVPSAPEMTG